MCYLQPLDDLPDILRGVMEFFSKKDANGLLQVWLAASCYTHVPPMCHPCATRPPKQPNVPSLS